MKLYILDTFISPRQSIKRSIMRAVSPAKTLIEDNLNISSNSKQQMLIKEYLNESERVIKMITNKLVKVLDDIKSEVKFPIKEEYRESIK